MGNGTTGLNDSETYWRIKGSENLTTCSLGLTKGDYYIKIVPYSRYNPDGSDYKFKVNFESSATWEKESNDSYEKATAIPFNTDISGTICKGDDKDWYSFTLTEAGSVTVSFTHPIYATTSSIWEFDLYSSNGTDGIIGESSRIYVTGDANCVLPPLYLDAGTYYIKAASYSSYSFYSDVYTLRLDFGESTASETEPNGSYNTSNTIETGKEYAGSLLIYGDVDYYKFVLDSQSDVTVIFFRKNENPTKLELTLYESNGTTRVGSTQYLDGNAQKSSFEYKALSAGTYYIKIEPYSSYQPALEPYGIEVLPNHEHTLDGEWTVTTEPRCTRDGKRQCLCTVCGAVCEEAVPALGHDYGEWIEQYAPTCEYQGYQYHRCSRCDDTEGEAVPALGHDYGGWTVSREATCSAKGVEKSVCSRCEDTKTRSIDKIEHTFGEPERIKGNIFDYPMIYKKECINCDYYETYEDNKARWAAPVIIIGGILILALAVLLIVLKIRKNMKAYAASQASAPNGYPPVPPVMPFNGENGAVPPTYPNVPPVAPPVAPNAAGPVVNADGSVRCTCGKVNNPGASFCTNCGKKLR